MTVTDDPVPPNLVPRATADRPILWRPPAGAFFAGRWQDPRRSAPVTDPEDGAVVGWVGETDEHEVDLAVRQLAEARRGTSWPLWERSRALRAAAERVLRDVDRLAWVISAEGAKTINEATAEVSRAAETLRLCADATGALEGRTVPFQASARGSDWRGWYTREPIGVVAAITPFNDPLNLVAHKIGPALLAGNAVALKPAPATPLSALALAEILLDCGVPERLLAVLPGHDAGRFLVAHRCVDVVSFTGGPATADRIVAGGPARKVLMELGGNNAVIVCADADLDQVATAVVDGAFGVAGQNCLSVQRVLVQRALFAPLVQRVVAATQRLVVGSKRDPRTDIGPMIDEASAVRVAERIADAVRTGARVHTGGQRTGAFVTPAVLTEVSAEAPLRTEEIFGPVVLIDAFDDLAEAAAAANAVDTGLQAGIFTADLDRAMWLSDQLDVGAVLINSTSDYRIDAMPFGGFKRSGIGREGVESTIEAMSEPKIIAIRSAGAA